MSSAQLPAWPNTWIPSAKKGGVDALVQGARPVSRLEANEVLIQMKAVSLNYRDLAIPLEQYPFRNPPTSLPAFTPNPTDVSQPLTSRCRHIRRRYPRSR